MLDKAKEYNDRVDDMISLYSVQGKSKNEDDMIAYITSCLDKMQSSDVTYQIKDRNIYVIKGNSDIYPCVVAHTDTVHSYEKDFGVAYHDDVLFGIDTKSFTRIGVGGDDRAGIYAALELLEHKDNIKAAFFAEEEIGCLGSGRADMSFFKDVSLVLQTDRRGHQEFVECISNVELQSEEFKTAVEPYLAQYGFVAGDGGMTDVMALTTNKKELGVSCANMSSGYYMSHTKSEYQSISELLDTIDLMSSIIDGLGHVKRWEHKYVPYVYEWTPPKGGYKHTYGGQNSYYRGSGGNSHKASDPKRISEAGPFNGYPSYEDWFVAEYGLSPDDDIYGSAKNTKLAVVTERSAECTGDCEHHEENMYGESVKWCMGCGSYLD